MKRVLYVFNSCKRSGPVKVMFNLISNLDFNEYEVMLITIYEEENDSMLNEFLTLKIKHVLVPLNKISILLGKTKELRKEIASFAPHVIHTLGVFSDYAISRMHFKNHVITLHNFMYEDYIAKFGRLKGGFLIKLHRRAIKNNNNVICCSSSLSKMYYQKIGKEYAFIRNGVKNDEYKRVASTTRKYSLRNSLLIPLDYKVFIYSGQFIERKNQLFLLDLFKSDFCIKNKLCLLLLGDGPLFESYKEQFEFKNIIFTGNVKNVESYLQASDFYISSSKSEGLPTGVLEGMSCGLPCILSNIPQHSEIVEINENCGFLYSIDNKNDCVEQIKKVLAIDYNNASDAAYNVSHNNLSSKNMADNYMELYSKLD